MAGLEGKTQVGTASRLESRAWRRGIDVDNSSQGFELPDYISQKAEQDLMSIYRKVRHIINPKSQYPIDIPVAPKKIYYDSFPLAFNRSYFYKNLFKCLITLQICKYHIQGKRNFIDLGAGAGPFSLAICSSVNLNELRLVDRSSRQLDIARRLLKYPDLDFEIYYNVEDFMNVDLSDNNCIASYALSEHESDILELVNKICKCKSIIIVDSPKFVKYIYGHLKEKGRRLISGEICFVAGEESRGLIEGGRGEFAYLCDTGPK